MLVYWSGCFVHLHSSCPPPLLGLSNQNCQWKWYSDLIDDLITNANTPYPLSQYPPLYLLLQTSSLSTPSLLITILHPYIPHHSTTSFHTSPSSAYPGPIASTTRNLLKSLVGWILYGFLYSPLLLTICLFSNNILKRKWAGFPFAVILSVHALSVVFEF